MPLSSKDTKEELTRAVLVGVGDRQELYKTCDCQYSMQSVTLKNTDTKIITLQPDPSLKKSPLPFATTTLFLQ